MTKTMRNQITKQNNFHLLKNNYQFQAHIYKQIRANPIKQSE